MWDGGRGRVNFLMLNPSAAAAVLRVASWNVLADAYVRADWFPLAPPRMLAAGARTAAVVALVQHLDVDVVALQEAEEPLVVAVQAALDGWDVRWCPKGQGRPDGCLTAVRRPWAVTAERRVVYDDGDPVSGHVAHLVEVTDAAGRGAVVANTHLRWAPPGTAPDDHIGVRQAVQVAAALAAAPVAVVASDTNDDPGGPVRAVLERAGFVMVHGAEPTSLVRGDEAHAIDVAAVRGAPAQVVPTGIVVAAPLPGPGCPSDHVPVITAVTLPGPRPRRRARGAVPTGTWPPP